MTGHERRWPVPLEEEIAQAAQRRAEIGVRQRLLGGERAAGGFGQQDQRLEGKGAFGARDGGTVAILRSGLAQRGVQQTGPGIADAVFETQAAGAGGVVIPLLYLEIGRGLAGGIDDAVILAIGGFPLVDGAEELLGRLA